MKQFYLPGNCGKLVLKENVLALLSNIELITVSSAIYNGGFKKVKAILNVQVSEEYSDRQIHENPQRFIIDSAKKLELSENFTGMITAAAVDKFALVSKKEGDLAVAVLATAVDPKGDTCSHAESAGEPIDIEESAGTINIIVIIDGNPTESCLISTLITATEAKTAALLELDIRSRYSGDVATGTVTDSMVVAKTKRGKTIVLGGPASNLGQLVSYCARKAVKKAVKKARGYLPRRSMLDRLCERRLPLEKLASELTKIGGLKVDRMDLAKILRKEPLLASALLAATKIDDDIKNELIPSEFKNISELSEEFGVLFSKKGCESAKTSIEKSNRDDYSAIDLPPFSKQVLINIVKSTLSKEKIENPK